VQGEFATELAGAVGPNAREVIYRRMLQRFIADKRFADYDTALAALVDELPESATAQSTNATSTNPGTNELIERSGLTRLIALSGDFRKVFSANDSAISVNLNAVALVGGGTVANRSAQFAYATHESLRRIGGTVTFGGKIPEKEITGISGVPGAEVLFDAMSWDVKVRVVGDRDPRASRWYPLLLGKLGTRTELLTRIQGIPVPNEDVGTFLAAANALLGQALTDAKNQIASSLQVSVKAAGAHLTNVEGKNKYSFLVLLDKGFASADFTLNMKYSVADATDPVAGAFKAKDFETSAALVGSIMDDAIVTGRSTELSVSFKAKAPLDKSAAPIAADRKSTYHLNATVALPFQLKAKIPISLTWSNDPNNLTKQKYVSGQIGVAYDFGAIWQALKAQ